MSETILPPNATPLEKAIDKALAERLDAIPQLIRTTDNPQTVPCTLLPWLGWAWSVDDWCSDWSETQKRRAIANSYYVHRQKGTIGSLKEALAAIDNIIINIIEWFEERPISEPYTFRVILTPKNEEVSKRDLNSVKSIINNTKNERSHLTSINMTVPNVSQSYYGGASLTSITMNIPAK